MNRYQYRHRKWALKEARMHAHWIRNVEHPNANDLYNRLKLLKSGINTLFHALGLNRTNTELLKDYGQLGLSAIERLKNLTREE